MTTTMQFTKTLDSVREQVQSDDCGKWDTTVPCRELALYQGRLVIPQSLAEGHEDGLTLTPWALTQLCQKVGIPTAYFKRCPAHLQDAQMAYWIPAQEIGRRLGASDAQADVETSWLLRAKGSTIRGVLSPRYAKLDNKALIETLLPLVTGMRYKVALSQLTSESFHLRLVDPTIARDVLPGDRLLVGIHLANSEVGLRAVTVDALVYRLVCSNGLIRRINSKSLLKQRHIHVAEPRFAQMLSEALGEAVMVAAGFIEQMAQATRTPIPDMNAAILALGQEWSLSENTQEMVRFSLLNEPAAQQETLYGLVNALTQAAQRLSVEERFELETRAGSLLEKAVTNNGHNSGHNGLPSRILTSKGSEAPTAALALALA